MAVLPDLAFECSGKWSGRFDTILLSYARTWHVKLHKAYTFSGELLLPLNVDANETQVHIFVTRNTNLKSWMTVGEIVCSNVRQRSEMPIAIHISTSNNFEIICMHKSKTQIFLIKKSSLNTPSKQPFLPSFRKSWSKQVVVIYVFCQKMSTLHM